MEGGFRAVQKNSSCIFGQGDGKEKAGGGLEGTLALWGEEGDDLGQEGLGVGGRSPKGVVGQNYFKAGGGGGDGPRVLRCIF